MRSDQLRFLVSFSPEEPLSRGKIGTWLLNSEIQEALAKDYRGNRYGERSSCCNVCGLSLVAWMFFCTKKFDRACRSFTGSLFVVNEV